MAMNKKKILFYFMKGDADGGSDYSLFTHLNHLDLNKYIPIITYRKYSPIIHTLEDKGFEVIHLKGKKKEKSKLSSKANSNIENISSKEYFFKKYLRSIKVFIKAIPETLILRRIIKEKKIDIIHLNHNLNGDRAGIIAGILTRIKIISHYRGLYKPIPIDIYLSKYINTIICISNFTKEEYVNNGIDENKCITIYNGVDTSIFYPQSKSNNNKIIGCVGRLEIWKGQQILLKAFPEVLKAFPNVKVQFIGDGSNMKELSLLTEKLGITNSVEFVGSVNNIKDYIKEFSIAVHTSINPEPFGRVIIEAMAMGKVVIATNIGGPKEIINNGQDGFLVTANNSKILAKKVIDILNDDELSKKISHNAVEKIKTKFESNIITKEIEKIYEK